MTDTPIENNTIPLPPSPPPATDKILEKIRAIVSEHTQDFLIVVSIDNNVHSLYKTKTNAFGMASMICHDINQDWWMNKNK